MNIARNTRPSVIAQLVLSAALIALAVNAAYGQATAATATPPAFASCSTLVAKQRLFISAKQLVEKYGWSAFVLPDGRIPTLWAKFITAGTSGSNDKGQTVTKGQYWFSNLGFDGETIGGPDGLTLSANTRMYHHCAAASTSQ